MDLKFKFARAAEDGNNEGIAMGTGADNVMSFRSAAVIGKSLRSCPETGTGSRMLRTRVQFTTRCWAPVPVAGQPLRLRAQPRLHVSFTAQ
jgi:hypothetical protein